MSEYTDRMHAFMHDLDECRADAVAETKPRPVTADHAAMMELVAQLSPESRGRIAQRLDDRFHEITGTPRTEDGS